MTALTNKTFIIMGASSGIGEATAHRLSSEGAQLVLAARRTDRLDILARALPAPAIACACDVVNRADVDAVAAAALERFGRIDGIVNCAGIMPMSPLAKGRVEDWDRLIDVNIRGVLHGINAVLGHLIAQGHGDIVNVGSIASFRTFPSGAVYSATKFAVRAIGDGLRAESGDVVRVTTVYPGPVASELAETVGNDQLRDHIKGLEAVALPAGAIADAIAFALKQPAGTSIDDITINPTARF
ncbi:hypothetical protein BSL82_11810 [Tardibacter chloracetimidivorans]|uniref:Ketoreductase domain-containing protein n=1 Tax=Tardibacter chloracetimidivorans TaxID=1921510 RepID=A0A1L3ZWA1_9SPHN|nr:SDR family oxidoreductase [Tardibacter chloracetimidivorans]API59912.1 hypothetical protein BSL82_11810 [Tardibacter chloracetimidivorans]